MANPNGFFASSPSVVIPPTQLEYFTNDHNNAPATSNPLLNGFNDSLTPSGSLPVTPGSMAGRKRSRGDMHEPDEEEYVEDDGSHVTPATEYPVLQRSEPILGPGMTLIHPDDPGYPARPESQSGTWVDERSQATEQQRPAMSTRKSQRMGSRTVAADDLAQLLLPHEMRDVTAEPLIDEATRTLGISWTRMDASEALLISQAAYSKWIQNHYPALQDVAVWFENSAIPGYLVAARNAYNSRVEYYIFSHDLMEARLVTSDAAQLIPRLQMLPALHLAAPGGCLIAEMDSAPAVVAPAAAVIQDGIAGEQMEMLPPEVPQQEKLPPPSMQQQPNKPKHFARMSEDFSMPLGLLRGYFPAHEMETD